MMLDLRVQSGGEEAAKALKSVGEQNGVVVLIAELAR
jgi:hypothetical protein